MICKEDRRRGLIRAHRDKDGRPDRNGIDYVEVIDDGLTLLVYFIGKLPRQLQTDRPTLTRYLRIEGGRRIRDIRVLDVDPHQEESLERDDYLIVNVDRVGDFSTYTVRLIGIDGIDARYDHADFSFKIDCPSDLDCATPDPCPSPVLQEPDINYLARDYASFRQLILDRLALIMPDWKERHVPDMGIALVELLAYVGDHLSYYQDAVATEAYLDTARQRISVRRHARLVDYLMHEGCNARAWLCLTILGGNLKLDLKKTYFITSPDSSPNLLRKTLSDDEIRPVPGDSYEVFEPVTRSEIMVYEAHNEIQFYTWGQDECCLPRKTTSASLLDGWIYVPRPKKDDDDDRDKEDDDKRDDKEKRDDDYNKRDFTQMDKHRPKPPPVLDRSRLKRRLDLHPGDVLIFEEVIGPETGNPADADPTHRCAVRLLRVEWNEDPVVTTKIQVDERMYELPTPVLDIEWVAEDALSYALCVSATGPSPDCAELKNVSVARGNVILVDHGRTIRPPEFLGRVPLDRIDARCECEGRVSDVIYQPGRFRPVLQRAGLTFHQPLLVDQPEQRKWVSAAALLKQDPQVAIPYIQLNEIPSAPNEHGQLIPWFELHDLTDPTKLIEGMRDPSKPLSVLLRWKLSSSTRRELDKLKSDEMPSQELVKAVRTDLQSVVRIWNPRFDLLGSGADDLHFVVEMDNDASAHLRFGDNDLGEQPRAGSAFYAEYRVGNGRRGNVGADAITHAVLIDSSLSGVSLHVRNPLPATGGVDAEPVADVKLFAPFAFRKRLERAVIAQDYARIAERDFQHDLQHAAARLVWTGSWYEADVAIDPFADRTSSDSLAEDVRLRLERYRRIGHDLRVEPAQHIPLQIELSVCVKPGYLRGHVKAALLEIFSNRTLPGGNLGFFHPDRLTFGDAIYLSQIVAAAQAVEGVSSVDVTKLQRLFESNSHEIDDGLLQLGPFEIADVQNDPNFPESGQFTLVMNGGR
jgi:hypothetical protein